MKRKTLVIIAVILIFVTALTIGIIIHSCSKELGWRYRHNFKPYYFDSNIDKEAQILNDNILQKIAESLNEPIENLSASNKHKRKYPYYKVLEIDGVKYSLFSKNSLYISDDITISMYEKEILEKASETFNSPLENFSLKLDDEHRYRTSIEFNDISYTIYCTCNESEDIHPLYDLSYVMSNRMNNGRLEIRGLGKGDVSKPVIYLYNYDEEVNVKVNFDNNTKFTTTYPEYPENGWTVYANPDGHLNYNDKTYRYLYWEASTTDNYDFSKGFCIEGSKTAEFLETTLQKLGLNDDEINEFIIYWLPLMQNNKYNVISFQTDAYENMASLDVTPAPDTILRVYMAWYPSEIEVSIEAQELPHTERIGKTVVEWGGTQIGGDRK